MRQNILKIHEAVKDLAEQLSMTMSVMFLKYLYWSAKLWNAWFLTQSIQIKLHVSEKKETKNDLK